MQIEDIQMVNEMSYKLTVDLPEYQRKYVKMLIERGKAKNINHLITELIENEVAKLFAY